MVAAAVAILCVIGVALILFELARFLLLVFAAVVLATVFDAMTRGVCRLTGLRIRALALTISVIGLLTIFLGAFALFGAQFGNQLETIRESIPAAIQSLESLLGQIGMGGSLAELLELGTQDLSNLATRLGGYAMAVTSGVTDFVLVFVGAIFIAANPGVYRRGLLMLMPQRAERTAADFISDASRGLRGWMVGQAVSSLVVAALTWVGLTLLGVPASGGLAIIAGLLDVIPMVGPIIAGIPAVLLALTVSPATALWTIGLYLLIQQLQGNFLQPMIQKHAVNVPPAVLLFAVFGAGILFGALGVLLAAPLTIVVFVLVQRVYVRELLGKPIGIAGEADPQDRS
ncbi:AI-2E family transporter [Croceicoccus marinus]|uniref:AI-2E family transporter n=1 Tax=Croceicoccus marinus TaxID=450378 RepID=A0A1Z1FEX8_9SPHN|nr:AI-2E family transporter [Croceicoccus marinus]